MRIDTITIFPEYLQPLGISLLGKAQQRGLIDIHVHDLRAWTTDPHRTVDDTPYGGGPGMVMAPEPWGRALEALVPPEGENFPRLILPSPSGRLFTQQVAQELAREQWLLFCCGRYEGIDDRTARAAASRMRVDELSLGDYVLAGGEAAVLVMVETITRLLPGVLGAIDSVTDDSFAVGPMAGLLEGPVYTKPASWRGHDVPAVLLSGDHAAIARWRRDASLRRTAARRPDLIARLDPAALEPRDREVLAEEGWRERAGRFFPTPPDVAES